MIRVTDKHVFFWSGWPSNWYPSIFTAEYEGKEYEFHNAEQYFMFVKAKTFGDDEIAERIERVFAAISDDPEITVKELSSMLNITQKQTENAIKQLKGSKRIHREGTARNGKWIVD